MTGPVGSNQRKHSGDQICTKDGVSVIDCRECGFKHIFPLPDEENLDQFYAEDFYETLWPEAIASASAESEWNDLGFEEKFQKFAELLPDPEARKLLDIGSGPGHFLKWGKDHNWRVLGIEPGSVACKFSAQELGVTTRNTTFNLGNYDQFGEFDVITLNKVFEHLPNPRQTLAMVNAILNPGGLVCITVPNDFNPLQEIAADHFQKDPWWVDPKEHINYFDSGSLQGLVTACGFNTEHITSSFPLEIFLLMGEDYLSDPKVGKAIHSKRKQFEMIMERSGNTALKRKLYSQLQSLGLGRELTLYARKVRSCPVEPK